MMNHEADLEPQHANAIRRPATTRRLAAASGKQNRENAGFILSRFHQEDGIRYYRFERRNDDATSTEVIVDADLRLLRKYGIVLQELPLLCRHLLERQNVSSPAISVTFSEELMKEEADRRAALKQAAAAKKKVYHGHRSARVGQDFRVRL